MIRCECDFFCVGMHSASTNSLNLIKYDMHKRFPKRSVMVVPDDKVTVDCIGVTWILLHTVSPIPIVSDNNIKAYGIMHARFKQSDYLQNHDRAIISAEYMAIDPLYD